MTDEAEQRTISTQTNLPKTNLAFSLLNSTRFSIPMSHEAFVKRMEHNEAILRSQMNALEEIDKEIQRMNNFERNGDNECGSSPRVSSENISV